MIKKLVVAECDICGKLVPAVIDSFFKGKNIDDNLYLAPHNWTTGQRKDMLVCDKCSEKLYESTTPKIVEHKYDENSQKLSYIIKLDKITRPELIFGVEKFKRALNEFKTLYKDSKNDQYAGNEIANSKQKVCRTFKDIVGGTDDFSKFSVETIIFNS